MNSKEENLAIELAKLNVNFRVMEASIGLENFDKLRIGLIWDLLVLKLKDSREISLENYEEVAQMLSRFVATFCICSVDPSSINDAVEKIFEHTKEQLKIAGKTPPLRLDDQK